MTSECSEDIWEMPHLQDLTGRSGPAVSTSICAATSSGDVPDFPPAASAGSGPMPRPTPEPSRSSATSSGGLPCLSFHQQHLQVLDLCLDQPLNLPDNQRLQLEVCLSFHQQHLRVLLALGLSHLSSKRWHQQLLLLLHQLLLHMRLFRHRELSEHLLLLFPFLEKANVISTS
eukprot:TRINITY_DN7163_c0_g1_i5.p1 TRINITY_DN7163_c0_g1~~TRINITY_DN7163_c0_g1_i5.p1  ORF type:complete len:173 (+),score=23.38 TRINITY_DN7163_c0_g1_i5:33-551(+)